MAESTTPPPLVFDDADAEVYGHLPYLVDGVTRGPVTEETMLVGLHQPQDSGNSLLENLAGVAKPKVLIQLVDGARRVLGPRRALKHDRFRLKLTYNKLILAPSVRIECHFLKSGMKSGKFIYLKLVLEFHFNPSTGPDTELRSYRHSRDNVITFTANGASCSGFNKLSDSTIQSQLGSEEREIISLLRSYISPESRHQVKILLNHNYLDAGQLAALEKIRSRLPGGSGPLLPSIGPVEYACFGADPGSLVSEFARMRRPRDLMAKPPRHPMVPLQSSDTFRTVKEAAVELAYSADTLFSEEKKAMELWSSVSHTGVLFQLGNFVVVGMRFANFPRLGCRKHSVQYRLPKDMSTKLTFQIPGHSKDEAFSALLMSNVSGLPRDFDAHFLVVSKGSSYFQGPGDTEVPPGAIAPPRTDPFEVRCNPRVSEFTFTSQLDTVSELQEKKNRRWRGLLLNQVHEALEAKDLTHGHGISEAAKTDADEWLVNFMAWNQEQIAVIDGIKTAKGGLVIVMGPAGTGKSLLQMALAIYFHKLGFHILALSPANSNANHLANALDQLVPFLRLYPSSRDHNTAGVTDAELWHDDVKSLPPSELLFAIDELERGQGLSQKFGAVEAVLTAAADRTLALDKHLRSNGTAVGSPVNAWDILREFIEKYKNGTLMDGKGVYTREQYKLAYSCCKGHIIGLQTFMVTTTGNILARDMVENFYSKEEVYGIPRVGIMVFVDEAAKDLEVNVWSGIVCQAWAPAVRGAFLFGDDKQLQPTNTSSKGDVIFNAFHARLDISLPVRLVREGFPCYRLVEQRRMHACLAAFPNCKIYDGLLRNGPGTNDDLEMRKPGLAKVLSDIILQSSSLTLPERELYQTQLQASDSRLRLHWIEVSGKRKVHPVTNSSTVTEHVDVFFSKIYPLLRDHFDRTEEKMGKNVMIICAYSYALHEYQNQISTLLANDRSLDKDDMPRVLTVDSSQGEESMMVIFDGSFQHGNRIGFMEDRGRTNVAITRAKEVFYVIGGNMARMPGGTSRSNLLLEYKKELNGKHCHTFD